LIHYFCSQTALRFFNGRFGQIRKGLTTPERPFEFLGKEKFFKIFAFFGVAEATRSSRQFLERGRRLLQRRAGERIKAARKGARRYLWRN